MTTNAKYSQGRTNTSSASLSTNTLDQTQSQGNVGVNGSNAKHLTRNPNKSDLVCSRNGPNNPNAEHTPFQSKNKRPVERSKNYNQNYATNQGESKANRRFREANKPLPSTSQNNSSSLLSARPQLSQKKSRTRSCKEVRPTSTTQPRRRFNDHIEVSLFDLVSAFRQAHVETKTVQTSCKPHLEKCATTRGGKTREVPKPKRHTKLKRIILDERAARKAERSKSVPASARLCTRSSGSPKQLTTCTVKTETSTMKNTEISPGMSVKKYQDNLVADLLVKLANFQDRAYSNHVNSPFLQKRAKRFVCGLHEVTKHLKLNNLKLIVVARNLEGKAVQNLQKRKETSVKTDPQVDADQSSNHSILEDILSKIWDLATQPDLYTPILITHKRQELAFFCHKPRPVSIIGVLSFEGALDIAKKLLALKTAVNIQDKAGEQLEHHPEAISSEQIKGDSPVLIPIEEEKEPEFDMVAKLREALKQLSSRENQLV